MPIDLKNSSIFSIVFKAQDKVSESSKPNTRCPSLAKRVGFSIYTWFEHTRTIGKFKELDETDMLEIYRMANEKEVA